MSEQEIFIFCQKNPKILLIGITFVTSVVRFKSLF
jgi:hypothetical protein